MNRLPASSPPPGIAGTRARGPTRPQRLGLAAGHVSHLGYARETTPALDALARDGVDRLLAVQGIDPAVGEPTHEADRRLLEQLGYTGQDGE